MLGRLRASWRLQPLLAVKDAKQTLQVAPLAAATSALGGPLATALPAAAPLRPAAAHARGWAAAAGEAEASAAAMASLAPCERGPEQQEANELDEQLSAAGRTRDPAAVLALINEALAGLEAGGSAFTELNTVTALAALADAAAAAGGSGGGGGVGPSPQDLVRSPACQALIDMVLAGMQRFPPPLLAQAVASFGRLGASDEMLLDEVGRHLMRHVGDLAAADITQLAGGLAALDHSPGVVLFDSLAARAAEIAAEFSPEQRQQVAAAYEALGYGGKAPRFG